MTNTHIALTAAGGSLELLGGLLVAVDVAVVPVTAWARAHAVALASKGRRTLQRFRRTRRNATVHGVAATATAHAALSVKAKVTSTDLKRQVELLEKHADRTDERLETLEAVPGQLRAEASEQRRDLEKLIAEKLKSSEGRYLAQRRLGFVLVALGGVLLASANLVQ